MTFFKKKPFFILGLFILGLIVLPITVFFFQNRQVTRSHADKTVILSFDPSSSSSTQLQIPAGSTFSLDVYVDPGASSVSFVKAELLYDATKFELAGGFIPNREVFSQIVEGPTNTPGVLTSTLSIGSDTSKALTTKTKVGTVVLKALSTVPTNGTSIVSFGPNSQALAISSNSSFNENVIANTLPVTIKFNQPTLTCGTSPTDVMLTIDKSGSMNDVAGTTGTKISNAKLAANSFIDILAREPRNAVGLSTFSTSGSLDNALTSTFTTVQNKVNAITTGGSTCIECGINKANQEITAHKRAGIKNVVVLLTDGLANAIDGSTSQVSQSIAEQKALAAEVSGHSTNQTIYFTIGLGTDVNSAFLTKLAEDSGGQYYYSPTTDQLQGIYTQISEILAKGAISGSVFNDANSNGILDANETNLPGWILQLSAPGTQTQTITTDSTGTYTFPNLCDGSYTVTQVNQSGWKQTYPINPKTYPVTVANGNISTDKDFGNNKGSRCSDGIDNDGNGFIDTKDATCHTDGDPSNPNSYDPGIDGENGKNTCSDSKDNNGNGKIDGADPICHTGGDPTKPWDPNLPEGTADTSINCSPSSVVLDDQTKQLSILLKTISGAPLSGKSVVWSSSTPGVTLQPTNSSTDVNGNASSSALVALTNTTPFTGTITAKFAGDLNNSASSCVIQTAYTPIPTATPTVIPSSTPTPTPAALPVTLSLDVLLHGVGNSGDNANPTTFTLSNKNPLTPQRKASVQVYDVNNILVSSASGNIQYNSTTGSFTGTVVTNAPLLAGKYTIKVTTDYHLTRLAPGIQTLVLGKTNQVPSLHLVAGDANNDNRLDIRDYNMLLDCYSDLSPAIACNPVKKVTTDANDDGNVNQFDYNLFLREISTQPGE